MTTATDIKWSSYLGWEGPFFAGLPQAKFKLPPNPTDAWRVLAVVVAAEGGNLSAINGYDRMILSAGAIQSGEAGLFGVSELLGAILTAKPSLRDRLQPCLDASDAEFKQRPDGRWRFFFRDTRSEVNTIPEQQQLFRLHATGEKGTWDDASKEHAKAWAAAVADVLADTDVQSVQIEWTLPRLYTYALKDAKTLLFGPNEPQNNDSWVGVARAIFLSFAVNLPAVASAQLVEYTQNATEPKWSREWTIGLCRQLVFGPKIAIYPRRWNDKRPVLEAAYGVDLPDFAADLEKWRKENDIEEPTPGGPPDFTDTKTIQEELLAAGLDLGPAGADGLYGNATRAAVRTFQQMNGIEVTGSVGPLTRKKLVERWLERHR
jgi:N-acetylmuramoyl-L-alanine amidase/peptidoglycan L-alanyl-D-glutamate endopeptidase CwlK